MCKWIIPVLLAMNSNKKDAARLPDGWVLCKSKSIPGRKYFFNKKTGKSSWSQPQVCFAIYTIIVYNHNCVSFESFLSGVCIFIKHQVTLTFTWAYQTHWSIIIHNFYSRLKTNMTKARKGVKSRRKSRKNIAKRKARGKTWKERVTLMMIV